ncbi:MAG: Endonuclease/exonuclease/phosphatase [Verrucomicrobia bacterium]|nr:Endonuclease/exonuclease/phosphatase [Verrucomicrobiota bacterium]
MKFLRPARAGLLAWLVLMTAAAVLRARPFTVMAYNVENLVDADGKAVFEDYQPAHYTRAHVLTKVRNVARVLARIDAGKGPDIILFAEIEADLTPSAAPFDYDALLRRHAGETIGEMLGAGFNPEIADLPAEALLLKACADQGLTGYHVVAREAATEPGGRPQAQKCVIFSRFPVKAVRLLPTPVARPILEAEVEVEGATLYLFDNHWKSGASDPAMERVRIRNARTLRDRIDEILRADPHADIILGGDFNSQYNQADRYAKTMTHTGLNGILGSQGDETAVRGSEHGLYNLWFDLPASQRASDTFRGEWGTLVQLIVSRGLLDFHGVQYVEGSLAVAKFPGLNMDAAGLPLRWSFEGPGGAGFSDHFPIYARFTTVKDNDPDRYLPPRPRIVEKEAEPSQAAPAALDVSHALTADQLPAGASLRSPAYLGRVVRVDGRVGRGQRLTVEFLGGTYDVWSFDARLRTRLRETYREGDPIRFYGELGQYKGHWQFVIRDENWVR